VTSRNSCQSEPRALRDTVSLNGLSSVLGAGGLEPAAVRGYFRDCPLVRPNQRDCLRPDSGRPPLP